MYVAEKAVWQKGHVEDENTYILKYNIHDSLWVDENGISEEEEEQKSRWKSLSRGAKYFQTRKFIFLYCGCFWIVQSMWCQQFAIVLHGNFENIVWNVYFCPILLTSSLNGA